MHATFSQRGCGRAAALALAVFALAPTLCSAQGGAGEGPLSGAAAFGDWHTDAPGVRRKITAATMPRPLASEPTSNPSQTAPRNGALPKVPPGFVAEALASDLGGPRVVRVAPNGDIFVAETGAGRVSVFRSVAGGKSVAHSVFAAGLAEPYGIAFYPPGPDPRWVYVASPDKLVRFPYGSGDTKASGRPQTIVDGIPTGGHSTRDVAFSLDGRTLYLSIGSGSNVGEGMEALSGQALKAFAESHARGAAWGPEERRADVLALDPDGRNQRAFATGLRNCAGLTIQPATGRPWCAVNERDLLGDDLPPDYTTSVEAGAFYGWPWYYIGEHEDPRLAGARPDLAGKVTVPDVLIQPHSAPLGIAFYTGGQFPADYEGDAFVTLHGSWNRAKRTGYKVVRLRFESGKPTGEYDDFMVGFVAGDAAVWGRPVGVATAKDGSLLVTDDESNTLWRVRWTGKR